MFLSIFSPFVFKMVFPFLCSPDSTMAAFVASLKNTIDRMPNQPPVQNKKYILLIISYRDFLGLQVGTYVRRQQKQKQQHSTLTPFSPFFFYFFILCQIRSENKTEFKLDKKLLHKRKRENYFVGNVRLNSQLRKQLLSMASTWV